VNIFTPGVTVEGNLPTEKKPETDKISVAKLLFGFTGLYERWRNEMEARRFDPGPRNEPDYERILREREGFNINDYHEGPKEPSWRDWLMNILGGLIVVGIGAVIYQLEDLKSSMAASLARQEMDDRRIDRLEQRVYRGSP
jgi:hypothetical protein